jgi:hypothetical protein
LAPPTLRCGASRRCRRRTDYFGHLVGCQQILGNQPLDQPREAVVRGSRFFEQLGGHRIGLLRFRRLGEDQLMPKVMSDQREETKFVLKAALINLAMSTVLG